MKNLKNKFLAVFISSVALLGMPKANAQSDWKTGDPLTIKFGQGDSAFTLTPWASLRFTLTSSDGEIYLNDPGSRIGLKFRKPCSAHFALFGHLELSMKLMSTGENIAFSPGNATDDFGFYDVNTTSKSDVFGLRQTYIGLDFFKGGRLTIGKQQGAYLDIADRTDITSWNSGFASYAYSPEGSDGGMTGTGRANSCITYRNDIVKRIHLAASAQLKINTQADSLNENINSFGASAIVDIVKGIDVAVGYHQVFFNSNYFNPDIVYGLESNPSYLILGAQYKNNKLKIGVNYAMQQHGDMTTATADTLLPYPVSTVYSGTGLEVTAEYKIKKWVFQAGLNLKDPEQDEYKLLNSNFGKQIIFYAVKFYPVKNIAIMFEGRYEDSKDANGVKIPSANMLGLRVDL